MSFDIEGGGQHAVHPPDRHHRPVVRMRDADTRGRWRLDHDLWFGSGGGTSGVQCVAGRAAVASPVGRDRVATAGNVARDARAVAVAAAHAAGRHGHRRAGTWRLRGREDPLPESPGRLRDRQPLSSGQVRGTAAGRAVPVRPHERESESAVPGQPALVRAARLRGAGARPDPAGRVPGISPRDVSGGTLGLAQPRLHAGGNGGLERHAGAGLPGDATRRRRRADGRDGTERRRRHLLVPGSRRRAGQGRGSGLPDRQHRARGRRSRHRRPLRLRFLDQLLPLVLARHRRADRSPIAADRLRLRRRPVAALRIPRCRSPHPPPVRGAGGRQPLRPGRRPDAARLHAETAPGHLHLVQHAPEERSDAGHGRRHRLRGAGGEPAGVRRQAAGGG